MTGTDVISDHVRQVARDIFQVRLSLPFALDHVNCYALRAPAGWTVVDAGLNTSRTREEWQAAFDLLGIRPENLRHIFLTHMHPDHFGATGWLQRWGKVGDRVPPVVMAPLTHEVVSSVWLNLDRWAGNLTGYFRQCGVPEEALGPVVGATVRTGQGTLPHPTHIEHTSADGIFHAGGRAWRLIHAPGHSDGQYLLYDEGERLLLSGDHVLMTITPNIGRWPHGIDNPLGAYMDSLRELRDLDVRLALPGHRALITAWSERLDQLLAHHDLRLAHTLAAARNATPYDVAREIFMFEAFSPHEIRFAVAEALAHLILLEERGQVIRDLVDGIWRFSAKHA